MIGSFFMLHLLSFWSKLYSSFLKRFYNFVYQKERHMLHLLITMLLHLFSH